MLIKEFRIVLPLSVEEYQIGQLYSVAEASKNETGGGEGVEVITNQPFDDATILGEKYPKAGSTEVHEYAWNAYPYCRTILKNPSYMRDNFMVKIETLHAPDRGTQANPHNLPPDVLKKREVVNIDIAREPIESNENPRKFKSIKTGRGPLISDNWQQECEPVMCAYKLVTVEFKWMGLQNKVESFIMKQEAKLFMNFHRQLFCWIDRWYGLTLDDIRALEAEVQRLLDEQRQKGPLQGSRPDDQ